MKIAIKGELCVSHDVLVRNMEHSKGLNLPKVELGQKRREGRLAVVGGGPSILHHLDEIREYSEVWAINGACGLLKDHGIDSWMFAVDPDKIVATWAQKADKALLCNRCDPSVFEVMKGKEVKVYTLKNDDPGGVFAGSSTATVAFHLAIECGFYYTDFFGCESSFSDAQTHAYQKEPREHLMWVDVNGKEYMTTPDFYLQATEMSAIIRRFGNNFRAIGGGLLSALIEHPEHDVTHGSPAFVAQLEPMTA